MLSFALFKPQWIKHVKNLTKHLVLIFKTDDFYFIGAVIQNFVITPISQDPLLEVIENRFDYLVSFDASADHAGLSGMEVAINFFFLCSVTIILVLERPFHPRQHLMLCHPDQNFTFTVKIFLNTHKDGVTWNPYLIIDWLVHSTCPA